MDSLPVTYNKQMNAAYELSLRTTVYNIVHFVQHATLCTDSITAQPETLTLRCKLNCTKILLSVTHLSWWTGNRPIRIYLNIQ